MAEELEQSYPAPVIDPVRSAELAGLTYVCDGDPGIRREAIGENGSTDFRYIGRNGELITGEETLARIRKLAIPPAWTEVWICESANGHLQATGRDAKGRKQYRYHPDWSDVRSQTKYHRMILFGEALPRLRERVENDLATRGLTRDKVLATIVKLMSLTFIRIGNQEYARANKSYGLTTLRDKHVKIDGSRIQFQFQGKSGQKHAIDVKDGRLARIVKQCRDIPGYELFQYYDEAGQRQQVGSGDVNAYLREVTGEEFSAKDFRTWGGSVLAACRLSEMGAAETATAAKHNIVEAVKDVAATLGNRPATCRKYYIHPLLLEAYQDGRLVDDWRSALAQVDAGAAVDGLSREESALLALLRQYVSS